jgi:hypothetical protein
MKIQRKPEQNHVLFSVGERLTVSLSTVTYDDCKAAGAHSAPHDTDDDDILILLDLF